jgi:hypothetical protein
VKFRFAVWVAAGAVALSTGCSRNQSTGASVNSEFRSGVSPDAQTIVQIRFDQLKTTDLYRTHQQLLNLSQFNSLAQRIGLDPRRDVSSLCVVWDGKHVVLFAKGTFSKDKLEDELLAKGAQRQNYRNFSLLTRGPDSVVFPKSNLALASSTRAVQTELDLLKSDGGRVPDELQSRLAEVPTDSQIWVVSRGGLPGANYPLRSDLDSAFSNFASYVTSTSLGIRVDTGSHLLCRVYCQSAEGAQRVNDALRGLIGLARLSTKDNQLDMLRLWDAVSISKDQQVVRIQADLPADLSDKLITQVVALRGHAGAILNPQR